MDPQREFQLGDWHVTPLRGVLHRDVESRRLTPKAMDVLLALAGRAGEVVERDALLDAVWQGRAQSDEPLNKCIAEIRRQLGDDRGAPRYIETIPKRGYRLIAKVAPLGQVPEASTEQKAGQARWLRYAAVASLAVIASWLWFRFSSPEQAAPDSVAVAVLPFDVQGNGAAEEAFSDGMHEELIGALSTSRALSVRSRRATLPYRDSGLGTADIARELAVDAVVDGSVRRVDDRLRVSVQLVNAATDSQLWAGNYDEDLSVADIFELQDRIANEIGTALEVTLTAPEDRTVRAVPTEDLAAYEHFMLGKYHYRRQLPGDLEASVQNFEAAVALDRDFADAWDWLAYAYNHAATASGHLSPHVAYPKARAAALRALEIEPELATAVSILGYIRAVYDWDWIGAERDLRRAVALSPGDSGTVWSLAHVLSILGRHDEAIRLVTDFSDLDPSLGRRHREVANRLMDAGRYDEALARIEMAAERGEEPGQIHDARGVALFAKGDVDAAVREFEQAVQARQRASATVARLAGAYAAAGRRADAAALLEELRERSASETVSPITMATAFMAAGDGDTALEFLEQAARDRDRGTLSLPADPFFRALHDHPRYAALIDAFALPDA